MVGEKLNKNDYNKNNEKRYHDEAIDIFYH